MGTCQRVSIDKKLTRTTPHTLRRTRPQRGIIVGLYGALIVGASESVCVLPFTGPSWNPDISSPAAQVLG